MSQSKTLTSHALLTQPSCLDLFHLFTILKDLPGQWHLMWAWVRPSIYAQNRHAKSQINNNCSTANKQEQESPLGAEGRPHVPSCAFCPSWGAGTNWASSVMTPKDTGRTQNPRTAWVGRDLSWFQAPCQGQGCHPQDQGDSFPGKISPLSPMNTLGAYRSITSPLWGPERASTADKDLLKLVGKNVSISQALPAQPGFILHE